MKDNPSREDITGYLNLLVFFHADDLRSDVARRPASIVRIRFFLGEHSQSEICNNRMEGGLILEDDVLQFDVPMRDIEFVEVGEALNNALHDLFHLG